MSALAPMAAPSVTSSPEAPASTIASRLAPSPMAPFGVTTEPWGSPPPIARALGDVGDDPFAPLAPYSRTAEPAETGVPGGPDAAIQFNSGGTFSGTANFIWSNQAIQLDGSLYLVSSNGGLISATSGILNLIASSNVNIVSNNGGIQLTTSGPNVIYLSTSGTGFVGVQNVLFRATSTTFANSLMQVNGGPFVFANSSGTAPIFTLSQPSSGASPLNIAFLPTSPIGLKDGDIWNNGGNLAIMGGVTRASGGGPSISGHLLGILASITSSVSAATNWAKSAVLSLIGQAK